MAIKRRMFSDEVTFSDTFLDMPAEAGLLYFQLGMSADDDGFVASPKMIQRAVGASDDSLKLLLVKKFLLQFQSGVCVIRHWRLNNYIRKQIYKPTTYIREKSRLYILDSGIYTTDPSGANVIPAGHFTLSSLDDDDVSTQSVQVVDLGKVKIGKVNKGKDKKEDILNIDLPEWFDRKKWTEWVEYRKEKKKPIATTRGANMQITFLERFKNDYVEIIDTSIRNDWIGLFPPKDSRTPGASQTLDLTKK